MKKLYYISLLAYSLQLIACSSSKHIRSSANILIADSAIANAHVGICLYNATDDKYLYNYQSDKYFIPASNTKIATCYIAMKHLGDSLVGLRYKPFSDSNIAIYPTGDPTLLHPDFAYQPVLAFLQSHRQCTVQLHLNYKQWDENAWGLGWSWDDYNDDYMAERSALPIYGNTAAFTYNRQLAVTPSYFNDSIIKPSSALGALVTIRRNISNNRFIVTDAHTQPFIRYVPFVTNGSVTAANLLKDTAAIKSLVIEQDNSLLTTPANLVTIHSQPTDSLLKIMMHRSDNFYAEQSLLMVSNEMLGTMNDEKIVDTLLKTDFAGLPQRPQWVDGSGLSRFNLFTPQDFVYILNRMRSEYNWNRITTIFETGGTGTLKNYYTGLTGKIYAKTGSLSNNIALSGYLITAKNKVLIFSVLVNNHTTSASKVRRAVERYLVQVQKEN